VLVKIKATFARRPTRPEAEPLSLALLTPQAAWSQGSGISERRSVTPAAAIGLRSVDISLDFQGRFTINL
jgi:hypothetical protein